jgi:epoxyqueuosine reductase
LWRPKRRGILRNAAIALGNHPHPNNVRPLGLGLNDQESLVRGASAWALGFHPEDASLPLLESRQTVESNLEVLEEIKDAISNLTSE